MKYYCDCAGKHREHRKYRFWVKMLTVEQKSGFLEKKNASMRVTAEKLSNGLKYGVE